MNEFEARTMALRQALLVGKENEKAEVTIARAEAFLAFLHPAPGKAVKRPAAAAPKKRGRPRKAA